MSVATHQPATLEDHSAILSMNLCAADVAELRAATGLTPREALAASLDLCEEPWVVLLGGRIVAVYGVSHGGTFGVPWFLSTGEVSAFSKTFLKGSREVILRFHEKYDVLSNTVDSRHEVAIRWLKWLGFTILPTPLRFHDPAVTFLQFVRYKHV